MFRFARLNSKEIDFPRHPLSRFIRPLARHSLRYYYSHHVNHTLPEGEVGLHAITTGSHQVLPNASPICRLLSIIPVAAVVEASDNASRDDCHCLQLDPGSAVSSPMAISCPAPHQAPLSSSRSSRLDSVPLSPTVSLVPEFCMWLPLSLGWIFFPSPSLF